MKIGDVSTHFFLLRFQPSQGLSQPFEFGCDLTA